MNDAFICDGVRTPIGRYGGALSSVRPDDLLAVVLRQLVAQSDNLDPAEIDSIVAGCANQAGEDNRNIARMSSLLAGWPDTVPGETVNQLCGSGLNAVAIATRSIMAGEADLVVAAGVESMSRAPFVMPKSKSAFSRQAEIYDTTIGWRFINRTMHAQFGTDTMPETAENVAEDFDISRADQDAFALRSQQRAETAQKSGRLAKEITALTIPQRRGDDLIVDQDEHLRSTTIEKLAALPTPFRDNGSVTAGNASGVNDGAAAILIASEAAVKKHGLTPLARINGATTAGVAPRIMGFGPSPAIKRLLARQNTTIDQYDHIELNEAFAAQALAVMRDLGLADDAAHVNPNGGAIALGHPLGMSGTRLALTSALELNLSHKDRALCAMCIGVGQGIALSMERV